MSGGSNNATIALPGHGWHMLWPADFGSFQLDIVGFLAILGEGSVAANAQVAALSNLFYLPRLIPAPQALLWPTRPETLPPAKGHVTAVSSGNIKDNVHHVAQVLLDEEMPTFMVRCVRVTKITPRPSPTWVGTWFKGQPAKAKGQSEQVSPAVTARSDGPLAWVALLGTGLSVALLILSFVYGDGMSLLATLLLSLLSTLVGISNKWTLRLAKPYVNSPHGDVAIRYPNGSFLVVKCDELVARELFFAPEEIDYSVKNQSIYRMISLIGTLMLMFGVIALANARLQLQVAWAGAYIVINIAQWIAAALPARLHWDLSCYKITEEGISSGPKSENFTEALGKAIMFTQSSKWARLGTAAAPQTEVWTQWLKEVEAASKSMKPVTQMLDHPVWPSDNPSGNIIWMEPEDFKAKDRYEEIKREFEDRASSG